MSQILRLSLPMTVWLIGFSSLYALQGLSCSRLWPPDLNPRAVLIYAAVLLVCIQGLMLWSIIRKPAVSVFMQWTATFLASVALGSAIWISAPVVALSVCG